MTYSGTDGEIAFLSIVNDAFVWATVEMGRFMSGAESAMTGQLGAGVYLFELYGMAPPGVGPTDAEYQALGAIGKANASTGRGQRAFQPTNADFDAAVSWFRAAYGNEYVDSFTAPSHVFDAAADVAAIYASETARNDGRPPVSASFIRNINPTGDDDYTWDPPPPDPNVMEIVRTQEAGVAGTVIEPPDGA